MTRGDRPVAYLIDSTVLLDVATEDPRWYQWSSEALSTAARTAPLLINPLIYAELSANYDTIEELDDALPDFYIGAHAAVDRLTLVTRDTGRYRTYFPTVELISPDPSG